MNSNVIGAIILVVVVLALVIAAFRKAQAWPTGISSDDRDHLSPNHDHPWAFALLGLSMVASAVLAYLVFDLRQDLREADAAIQDAVDDAERAIQATMTQALAAIPDTDELERSLNEQVRMNREQQAAIDEHENRLSSLSGFGAASVDATNIEVPLFCSGEIAIWSSGFGRGLTC